MKTRRLLTVLTSTAALLAVAGCGTGSGATGKVADRSAADGRAGLPMGAATTVPGTTDGAVGSIRIWDPDSYTRSTRELSDLPREGAYVQVRVSAKAVGRGNFDVYPYDFYLQDAQGRHYEYGLGNGFAEYGSDQLSGQRLRPGQQVDGALLFDASPRARQLVYAPFGRPVRTWQLASATTVPSR
jgi:hypothetical protein